jgi:hypothetical protein
MFLLQSPYAVIAHLPGTSVVRFKRLSEASDDPVLARTSMQQMVDALNLINRADHSLLMDMRDGPTHHASAEFERVLSEYRPKIMAGFEKIAVLVKTSVGKLQVNRMAREDNLNVRIFDDEAEALAYLTGRPKPR